MIHNNKSNQTHVFYLSSAFNIVKYNKQPNLKRQVHFKVATIARRKVTQFIFTLRLSPSAPLGWLVQSFLLFLFFRRTCIISRRFDGRRLIYKVTGYFRYLFVYTEFGFRSFTGKTVSHFICFKATQHAQLNCKIFGQQCF